MNKKSIRTTVAIFSLGVALMATTVQAKNVEPKVEIFRGIDQKIESIQTKYAIYKLVKEENSHTYQVEVASIVGDTTKESALSSAFRSFKSKGKSFKVIGIGEGALADKVLPSSIVLPENISYIDDEAFANSSKLKTVTLHKGVKRIGAYAFAGGKKLQTLAGLDSVKNIGDGCLVNCPKLKEISLAKSTKLGQDIVNENVQVTGRKTIPRDEGWKKIYQKLQKFQQAVVKKAKESGEDLSKLTPQDIYRFAHDINHYSDTPEVVNGLEFKAMSAGKVLLYRGIAPDEKSAEDYIEQFKSGEFFGSAEGSGIFTTSSLAGAKGYAFPKNGSTENIGKVMQSFLKNGAKVIKEAELNKVILRYKYQCKWTQTTDFQFEKFLDTIFMYATSAPAVFAEALEKDAIHSNDAKQTEEEAKFNVKQYKIKIANKNEYKGEQYIILNRSALVVSEEDINVEVNK